MISVIDLDPKPVHRITNWVKRKEEWLQVNRTLKKREVLPSRFFLMLKKFQTVKLFGY